ncbi:hypothetical protein Bca4012_083652 [Brassica carinata]
MATLKLDRNHGPAGERMSLKLLQKTGRAIAPEDYIYMKVLFQACYMEDTSSRSLGKRCNSLKSNRVEPEYSQKSYWSTDRSENTCEQ